MGLFGSKFRLPIRQMLPQDTEDTPNAYPAQQVKDPGPSAPTKPMGMFGGSYQGPKLNRMQVIGAMLQQLGDNRGQLNELYQLEDQRQRGEFERQRQQEMMAMLQGAVPEDVKPYVAFAPDAVVSGLVNRALKPQQAQRPVIAGPGAEIPDIDPATGRPRVDPKTGMPIILYRNQNFAPRNSRAPVVVSDPVTDNPDLQWEDKR